MGVTVGFAAPPTDGSSVSTLLKLLPETVPWFETCAVVLLGHGLLTVTRNLMMMLLLAGSVPTATETGASGAAARSGSGLGWRGTSLVNFRLGIAAPVDFVAVCTLA